MAKSIMARIQVKAAAIRAAVDTAHRLGLLGHDAQVLLQGMSNQNSN